LPGCKNRGAGRRKNNIPVTLLCDTNHVMDSDYSEVKIIGAGEKVYRSRVDPDNYVSQGL
jgi:hypothetical protein